VTSEPTIRSYDRDDDLLAAAASSGRVQTRIYRYPDLALVLGRGSRPEAELHLDACRHDRIPILRRRGGGCSVLLDPGNLVVAVALPLPGLGQIRRAVDRLTDGLIAGLAQLGCPDLRREGISDLAMGDRKVAGSCVYRRRGLLFYSATVLTDPDIDAMERYLRHPPREPAYRRGRPHREFVRALTASEGPELAGWEDVLARALLAGRGVDSDPEG